jgi:hypothetical protein
MENIHGESHLRTDEGDVTARMEVRVGGETQEDEGTRARLSDLGDRASGFAGRMRDGLQGGIHEAAERIDERTGIITTIKANPMATIGVAFASGVAIAALSAPKERHWLLERARFQFRTALIGGVTGFLAQELRTLLGNDGIGELVESFLDR